MNIAMFIFVLSGNFENVITSISAQQFDGGAHGVRSDGSDPNAVQQADHRGHRRMVCRRRPRARSHV
jgi:folate-dependent phosphoribosylglycinamide formyltransferase PurN